MRHLTTTSLAVLLLVALACLLVVSAVLAATSDDYDLSWWTVDAGGQSFRSDARYSLGGTIGQPDAGILEGGGYTLVGGFWGAAPVQYLLRLPLALRNY